MWYGVVSYLTFTETSPMSYPHTHIRWKDVLERKDPVVLPFLRYYHEVGLVPDGSVPGADKGRAGQRPGVDRRSRRL